MTCPAEDVVDFGMDKLVFEHVIPQLAQAMIGDLESRLQGAKMSTEMIL